ncbi:hypothetical protein JNJ66_01710 [Candidatus Saccharibacteria bacterium]|nr:hypothetical protein [Candidatus Saccharibacteria bacterium]
MSEQRTAPSDGIFHLPAQPEDGGISSEYIQGGIMQAEQFANGYAASTPEAVPAPATAEDQALAAAAAAETAKAYAMSEASVVRTPRVVQAGGEHVVISVRDNVITGRPLETEYDHDAHEQETAAAEVREAVGLTAGIIARRQGLIDPLRDSLDDDDPDRRAGTWNGLVTSGERS